VKLLVASSNPGKLREYQALAAGRTELALFPGFDSLPPFDESAPTFAENAAGKALHYSRHAELPVIADDSGLVVPALDGAPGPKSARYAGPNASDADRVQKLLDELREKNISRPPARFVCVLALAERGQIRAVFSDFVEGTLLDAPRGSGGFGYDPIFFFPPLGKTFAELSREEKNKHSHRGKTFRKLLEFLARGG
jgi:XTP/dITP diphosphohydrolase